MNRLEYYANFGYYLSIVVGCICQVTNDTVFDYVVLIPHHTVDKNCVPLKLQHFLVLNLKKNYIS